MLMSSAFRPKLRSFRREYMRDSVYLSYTCIFFDKECSLDTNIRHHSEIMNDVINYYFGKVLGKIMQNEEGEKN